MENDAPVVGPDVPTANSGRGLETASSGLRVIQDE
jgi:hypothetical protein